MKKSICLVLAFILALGLFGCASTNAGETTAAAQTTAAAETVEATEASSYPTEPDGSIKQGRIPNTVGRTAEFAQLEMKSCGFTNVTLEEVDSEEAAGTVVSQDVEAYITMPVDTAVTLYVSNGNAAGTEAANG